MSDEILERLVRIESDMGHLVRILDERDERLRGEFIETRAAVRAAHRRLDELPRPDDLKSRLADQEATIAIAARRLDRLLWVIAGVALSAGGGGAFVGAIIGGG